MPRDACASVQVVANLERLGIRRVTEIEAVIGGRLFGTAGGIPRSRIRRLNGGHHNGLSGRTRAASVVAQAAAARRRKGGGCQKCRFQACPSSHLLRVASRLRARWGPRPLVLPLSAAPAMRWTIPATAERLWDTLSAIPALTRRTIQTNYPPMDLPSMLPLPPTMSWGAAVCAFRPHSAWSWLSSDSAPADSLPELSEPHETQ